MAHRLRRTALVVGTLVIFTAANAGALDARAAVPQARSLPQVAAAYDRWLRATELSSVVAVTGVYDTRPGAPRYVLYLAVSGQLASDDATARGVWTTFRGSSIALGLDIEPRMLVKFARLVDAATSEVAVVLVGPAGCWHREIALNAHGFTGREHPCGAATPLEPSSAALLHTIARRVGACTVRPRVAFFDDARAQVDERLVRGTARLSDQILAGRLQRYFHGRGQYRVVRQSDHLIESVVDNMRGEVLDGARRWERLEIVLVTSATDDGRLQVVLSVDGQYAPGIGARAPDRQSYRDMEPKYADALSTYTKTVMNDLVKAVATSARGAPRTAAP